MHNYPADAYAQSNMVVVRQVRMALPEGWRFTTKNDNDPKEILFRIKDTGSDTVMGALRYNSFDFPVAVSRAAPLYADKTMGEFSDREIAKTEIDGRESYVIQGTWKDEKQRASALIQQGQRGISEITLAADMGYFAREPNVAYTIFNSYQYIAGMNFPARAVGKESVEKKHSKIDFIFQYGGKNYRLEVYRTTQHSKVADIRKLHEEPEIRRALDTYFYFNR